MSENWHNHLNNLTIIEQIDRFFNPSKYSCTTSFFPTWIYQTFLVIITSIVIISIILLFQNRKKFNLKRFNPLIIADYIWEWLNTDDVRDCTTCESWCAKYPIHWYCYKREYERKAKQEIKELITQISFIMSAIMLSYVIVEIEGIKNKGGSGFIWFGLVVIYLIWASVILHTRKAHKHQIQAVLNPTENHQSLNG